MSILKPAILHARHLYELFGFEKVAAKFAASYAGFLQTADPYSPDGTNTWDKPAKGNNPATLEAMSGQVQKIGRGDQVIFAPGTQRPSGAFIALVRAIFREIAMGTNLPYGFICDMSMFGGVTARLETQPARPGIPTLPADFDGHVAGTGEAQGADAGHRQEGHPRHKELERGNLGGWLVHHRRHRQPGAGRCDAD